MSTRALVRFYEGDVNFTTVYQHCDGYPEGLGATLVNIFNRTDFGRGASGSEKGRLSANGMRCFAAWVVALLKEESGHIYIYHPDVSDIWEEYVYHVRKSGVSVECVPAWANEEKEERAIFLKTIEKLGLREEVRRGA